MRLHATVSKDGHKLRTCLHPSRRIAVAQGRPQCSSEGVILSCVSDEYS